jgi:hypothetical protein
MNTKTTCYLICTDLDRTLLPNGDQPESPAARTLFATVMARPDVKLAYVSGRHVQLIEEAIAEFALPQPDFIIADVGTSLYRRQEQTWLLDPAWQHFLAHAWIDDSDVTMRQQLGEPPDFKWQDPCCQSRFKLSLFGPITAGQQAQSYLHDRLQSLQIAAQLIYSIDEQSQTGLLDIIPARAGKRAAVEFLAAQEQIDHAHILCAGDSGNDLDMLTGPQPAVLVANATDSVRQTARQLADQSGTQALLYCAQGQFRGMNGYYAAGILEGIAHYFPHLIDH